MAPIDPKFVEQAQKLHIEIYSGELKILNSGRVPAKRYQAPHQAIRFGGAPPSAEADDSATEPARSLATPMPSLSGRLSKIQNVVQTARVDRRSVVDMSNGRLEYNEAKLEQLASLLPNDDAASLVRPILYEVVLCSGHRRSRSPPFHPRLSGAQELQLLASASLNDEHHRAWRPRALATNQKWTSTRTPPRPCRRSGCR